MASHHASDLRGIWLATTPADALQRRLTWITMAVLAVAFATAVIFSNTPMPQSNGFIPFIQAVMFACDLITAILLFTQFAILRLNALLVLASGYFFAALMGRPTPSPFRARSRPTVSSAQVFRPPDGFM